MNTLTSIQRPEQLIYDHLLTCVKGEHPTQVLKRFHQLFILNRYGILEVREALEQVLSAEDSIEKLLPFFNRCCYILINRWQLNPMERSRIGELTDLIKQVNTPGSSNRYARVGKRLRQLVYQFCNSDYFRQICRLAELSRPNRYAKEAPLISLIDRYPYLYSHCLVNQQDDAKHQKIIKHVQRQNQQKFEEDLARYVAISAVAGGPSLQNFHQSQHANPTLLSHKDVYSSLKHFVGPSTRQGGYRKSSSSFIQEAKQQKSFGDFKQQIHRYIIADLDPGYVQCKFNQQLLQTLESISPDQHQQPMSNLLMNRTFNQLMNFLVIENRRSPKHFVFMDLISNLGTTQTVGLLLKLVLIGKSVKSSLERRLSLLFNHYENHQQGTVGWLVRCLEKFQLAFTSHFGKTDLSYLLAL